MRISILFAILFAISLNAFAEKQGTQEVLTETFAVKTIDTLAALDTLANEEQSDEEEESAPEDTGQDE